MKELLFALTVSMLTGFLCVGCISSTQSVETPGNQPPPGIHQTGFFLSGDLSREDIVEWDMPEYPGWARCQGVHEATIILKFNVDSDGIVLPDIKVVKSTGYSRLGCRGDKNSGEMAIQTRTRHRYPIGNNFSQVRTGVIFGFTPSRTARCKSRNCPGLS